MKNKLTGIVFLLLLLVIGFLILKDKDSYNIEEAKQELKNGNSNQTINAGESVNNTKKDETPEQVSNIIVEAENFVIEKITKNQSLTLDIEKLSKADFNGKEKIDIYGTAGDDVESIQVEFTNFDSSFKNDTYILKTYSQGAGTFKYVASPEYKVLDYGENTYIFTANSKEGESITKLTIKTLKTEKEEKGTSTGSVTDVSFPKGDFGEAIILDDKSVYYSDLKGLEIQKKGDLSRTICEAPEEPEYEEGVLGQPPLHSITNFLLENYSSWVYWNTCRPITKEKGISFYVLRLDGDEEFKYEKHYLDYNNELHGIIELKSGTGVTKENIGEKNSEFKDEEFEITNISDKLFEEILLENRS